MPKKTKKQKILAKLHRKLALIESSPNTIKKSNTSKKQTQNKSSRKFSPEVVSFKFRKKVTKATTKQKNTTAIVDYSFVKHDLIKISIFTTLALALQGVLYFLLNK